MYMSMRAMRNKEQATREEAEAQFHQRAIERFEYEGGRVLSLLAGQENPGNQTQETTNQIWDYFFRRFPVSFD